MSTSDSLFEALKGNICLSGGADGSDLQWGMNAGRDGQSVIHWSFSKHQTQAPKQELVDLTQDQLESADEALRVAGKALKRSWPGTRSLTVKSLLRRNWFQVRWAESVYAVSTIHPAKQTVNGGTGWAVQMFLDRFTKLSQFEPILCYVYDQKQEQWYQYVSGWKAIDSPPKPQGIWAGIGTRELNSSGKWAIRNLFGWFQEDKS